MISQAEAQKLLKQVPKSHLPPYSPKTSKITKSDDNAAYTYNWDTVFSSKVPDVNKAIAELHSSPTNFSDHYSDDSGTSFDGSATFEDWQICQGGDGKLLHMDVPFTESSIQFDGGDPIAMGKGKFVIEIRLHYLPHTDDKATPNTRTMKLVAKTTSTDPSDPVVSIVNASFETDSGIVAESCLQTVFAQWINNNLDQFTHIFAVVDISDTISADEQWAFVHPSYTSYACLTLDNLEDCIFAVLTMSGGRTGENNVEQVSWTAITEGHRAAYLVSQERFLTDLIRPAMAFCYDGLSEDMMELTSDKQSLKLKDGLKVQLESVENDGETYDPVMDYLMITANNQELVISSRTMTDISPGITSECQATHFYNIELVTQGDGKQTLGFKESQEAVINHITHKSEGVIIGQIIAAIITAVGIAVATVLTDGAMCVVAAGCVGLVGGVAIESPDIIAICGTDDAPPIDALIINATDPIRWPTYSGFTLDWAGLNVSLQLEGTLDAA